MNFLLVRDDATKVSFIEAKYSAQWQIVETESKFMKKKQRSKSHTKLRLRDVIIAIIYKTKKT